MIPIKLTDRIFIEEHRHAVFIFAINTGEDNKFDIYEPRNEIN